MPTRFLDLYEAEYHRVVAFLLSYGASLADAQDATQEAFVEAWVVLAEAGAWEKVARPSAWIRTIALRRYQRPPGPRRRPQMTLTPFNLLPESAQSHPEPGELIAQALDVQAALRTLDPDSRTVLAFRMDGFSHRDIATHLGMDPSDVDTLLRKARRHLASVLAHTRELGGGASR